MSSSVPFDTSKLATSDPQVLVALIKYYYRDCIQLLPEEILIRLYSSLGTLFILQKRQDLKCSIYFHLFTLLFFYSEIQEACFRVDAIQMLLQALPQSNKTMLQYLLSFLNKLSEKTPSSKCSLERTASIFGPHVFHSSNADTTEEKNVALLKEMLTLYDQLFVHLSVQFKMREGKLIVLSATLQKVVNKLVDENYHGTRAFQRIIGNRSANSKHTTADEHFVDIVLSTHQYFISSADLVDKLIQMCAPSLCHSHVYFICSPACYAS